MTDNKNNIVPAFAPKPTGFNFMDLEGHVYGRLTVLGFAENLTSARYWWCQCTCGAIKKIAASSLRGGITKSCGCLRSEKRLDKRSASDDGRPTPEIRCYYAAKNRCTNPKHAGFANYGGRGIKFRFESFYQFIEHVGIRPSAEHSIDRIDVNGHYEVGNVRWATKREQANNRRTSSPSDSSK